MSDNDFVYQAVARAKQIAAKLGAGGDGSVAPVSIPSNGAAENISYSAPPMIGAKRPAAPDSMPCAPLEKRSMVTDKLSAAAEAAAKINEKLGGPGAPYINNPLANQILTIIHKIPDKYVGLVIGKKGEQIITLQADSQCKVVIAQEGGLPEREITMTGTQSQIDKAKGLINDIVERAGGSIAGGGTGNNASIDVMIPGLKAGLVIGKNGETIKQLQESTGAKMVLIQETNTPTADDKPLRITGDSDCVEKAKNMVIALLANKDGKPLPRIPYPSPPENADLCVYAVPTEKAGLVIGKGGETIREICGRSGAFVEISKQQAADPGLKLFNIRGQRHEIDNALRFISERAGIPVSAPQNYTPGGGHPLHGGAGGNYAGNQSWPGYGNQQQGWPSQSTAHQQGQPQPGQPQSQPGMPQPTINPQTGQPDYSAAWAEYYRRQGMHDYADVILRQAQQSNSSFPSSQANAQPQSQQQYDYSQQQWQQWQQWQQQQGAQGVKPVANNHGQASGQPSGHNQWPPIPPSQTQSTGGSYPPPLPSGANAQLPNQGSGIQHSQHQPQSAHVWGNYGSQAAPR